MTITWRAAGLLWKEWEGETVAFNVNSGDTHLVNSTAVDVLRILEREQLSAGEISDRLISRIGINSDPEITKTVEGLLKNLDYLGLIEPVSQ